MRLLILCVVVLSVGLAVSFASPVKTKNRQVVDDDLSDSSESAELKDAYSSGETKKQPVKWQEYKIADSSEDSSEEQPLKENSTSKDEDENSSSSEEEKNQAHTEHNIVLLEDNEILDRSKRAIQFTSHKNDLIIAEPNNLHSFKPRVLKLNRLRRELASNDLIRAERSADSSGENSSEEDKKGKEPAASPAEGAATNVEQAKPEEAKPEEAKPEEAKPEEAKPEEARRRRNADISNEADDSLPERNVNEVFIFSNEKPQTFSHEDEDEDDINDNEQPVFEEDVRRQLDKSGEYKNSEEEYARGCGGNNSHHDSESNEDSSENNETEIDKF